MSFSPFNWIRDFFGIRKDLIDAKKSQLEIQNIEYTHLSRELVLNVSLEDILKYDTKRLEIILKAEHQRIERESVIRYDGILKMLLPLAKEEIAYREQRKIVIEEIEAELFRRSGRLISYPF